MEVRIIKDGEVTFVQLTGFLDFETAEKFRHVCLKTLVHHNIVFDFHHLNFVGSSGITPFIDVLREFKTINPNPIKFCSVSLEFRRLFWAKDFNSVEIYEDPRTAYISFYEAVPQVPALHFQETEQEIDTDIIPDTEGAESPVSN